MHAHARRNRFFLSFFFFLLLDFVADWIVRDLFFSFFALFSLCAVAVLCVSAVWLTLIPYECEKCELMKRKAALFVCRQWQINNNNDVKLTWTGRKRKKWDCDRRLWLRKYRVMPWTKWAITIAHHSLSTTHIVVFHSAVFRNSIDRNEMRRVWGSGVNERKNRIYMRERFYIIILNGLCAVVVRSFRPILGDARKLFFFSTRKPWPAKWFYHFTWTIVTQNIFTTGDQIDEIIFLYLLFFGQGG